MRPKVFRVVGGSAIWIVVAWGLWTLAFSAPAARSQSATGVASGSRGDPRRLTSDLLRFATGDEPQADLAFEEPTLVAIGDPIFARVENGGFQQVGEIQLLHVDAADAVVKAAGTRGQTLHCRALFYPSAPAISRETTIEHYRTPDSMAWVIETMLPPEKRKLIAGEIKDALEGHREEILQALRPVIDASLRDAFIVIEADLPAAIVARKPRFEKLAARYETEIIDAEIAPLVKKEIWPIMRQYAEPAVEDLGQQLLARVSVWNVLWRLGADQIPFTRQNRLEEEMKRFLREEAVPMLESRTDEFIDIQKKVLADAANNSEVQAAVKRNVSRVLNDPEFQTLVWEIVNDVVLHNARLHEVLNRHWTSPEAHAAFELAAERFEPAVRRIGVMLFGTQEDGLSPEFAAVLRNQVLGKDKRWFIVSGARSPESHRIGAAPPLLKVHSKGDWQDSPFIELESTTPE